MMSGRNPAEGIVIAVLIADRTDSLISRRVDRVEVGLEGFAGDKHTGFTRRADGRTPHYPRGTLIRNDRQISLVSQEDLHLVADRLGVEAVQPEWLGGNLLLRGVFGLTLLPPATRLVFEAGVTLVVQAENMPCSGPGRVLAAQFGRPEMEREFVRAALHLRGVVAVVEHPGSIHAGEGVSVNLPGAARRKA